MIPPSPPIVLATDHKLSPPRLGGPIKSTLKAWKTAPGLLTTKHAAFQAASAAMICKMLETDNEGESWGIRSKATERMMASSTTVHIVAESGEVRRRELDHVGSGVVK